MNNDLRKQVIQRYVADRALHGASMGDLAKGIVNPVEQLKVITDSTPRKRTRPAKAAKPADSGGGIFAAAFAVIILLWAITTFACCL